jgi:hypothetical protein
MSTEVQRFEAEMSNLLSPEYAAGTHVEPCQFEYDADGVCGHVEQTHGFYYGDGDHQYCGACREEGHAWNAQHDYVRTAAEASRLEVEGARRVRAPLGGG